MYVRSVTCMWRRCGAAVCCRVSAAARARSGRDGDGRTVTPPEELLTPPPDAHSGLADADTDADVAVVPGDTYGIVSTRSTFRRPLTRWPHRGELGQLMPPGTHPLQCVNVRTVRSLCGRLGVRVDEAVAAMRETACDVNAATHLLVQRKRQQLQQATTTTTMTNADADAADGDGDGASSPMASCNDHRAYGLVCLEAYAPETFCLVSYTLPSFAATRNDDVLDTLHELTLSAAELPLDTAPDELMQRFVHHWTTNDDTPCSALLDEYDIGVREVVLLPYGEYAVQGFRVLHAVTPSTPNIGTAAAACCLDLRTGIHNRFRFHVERVADTLSEHVLREQVHYDQGVHLLRQPFWFRPEYSVEDYIRYKEEVLKPSAAIAEMRYAAVYAAPHDLPGYRNRIALEQLYLLQHRHNKGQGEAANINNGLTSMASGNLQTVANSFGPTECVGAAMHRETNNPRTAKNSYETRARSLRDVEVGTSPPGGEAVFAPFYRNHYF